MDVSGKRRARVKSAVCALRSVEYKFQNFRRIQIDNLSTLFTDALVAQETLRSYKGSTALQAPRFRFDRTQASPADEAETTLRDKRLALAALLDLPDPEVIRLRGMVYDDRFFDDRTKAAQKSRLAWLKQIAFANRPDVQAQRWSVYRALADLDAVRASRLDDVTFLVQPYTYSPLLPNRVGWALGITVPMPIYNRQQGNLAKAQQVVAQTQAVLTSLENAVAAEVEAAYNAIGDTWSDIQRFGKKMAIPVPLPPREFREDERPKDAVVEQSLKSLNGYVRELKNRDIEWDEKNFYTAVIQHRKSLMRMNTACACNVWGIYPSDNDPPVQLAPAGTVAPGAR
jgi:cobalt-zinc-cadmium efflux system outer membrane protein